MELSEKEFLLHRIFSGTTRTEVGNGFYVITSPNREDRYKAQEVYKSALKSHRYEEWFTNKQILMILEQQGIFSSEDSEKLEKLEKDIEELKFQLFKSMLNAEKMKFIRSTLKKVREYQYELSSKKHSLDYLTLEGYASLKRSQYLVSRCLYYDNGERVFSDSNTLDNGPLIEKAIIAISASQIAHDKIREMSRSEPWRSYWGADKTNVFGAPAVDLTDEQRSLILYSRMYDGAYEHPECPDEKVIEDDDMFDGWMIFQKKNREKKKTQKSVDSVLGKKQREAEEIFIPSTQQQSKNIEDLNTADATFKRKRRDAIIYGSKEGKQIKDSQFPDRRAQIITQANREFAQKGGG